MVQLTGAPAAATTGATTDNDPLAQVRAAHAAAAAAAAEVRRQVLRARAAGVTWKALGAALDLTGAGAVNRYGRAGNRHGKRRNGITYE